MEIIGLFTDANVLLTRDLTNIVPKLQAYRAVNRLLDGSWHIQTIGTPAGQIRFTALVDHAARVVIDLAFANGLCLKVLYRGETYRGFVADEINWVLNHGIYFDGDITLNIVEA